MRNPLFAPCALLLSALPTIGASAQPPAVPAAAAPGLIGEYQLAEGPDVGGGLEIAPDGTFLYALYAGALDERAGGRWEQRGDAVCLFTEPRPVPPAFEKAPLVDVDGAQPTIFVSWPTGEGVAGVTFTIGFDSGDPVEDYTQYYGWTMPEDDKRVPRWVEVREPIYDVTAPRYELGPEDKGRLHVRLVPNDMGVVDFQGACLSASGDRFVLRRREGELRFARVRVGEE